MRALALFASRTALTGALLALAVSLGCSQPDTCDARGTATPLYGVVTYTIGSGAGTTLGGSIDVFDYHQDCYYDDEELAVSIGGCLLWVSLQQGAEPPFFRFPGNPSAWAAVESDQSCDLALASGTVAVAVTGGTLVLADATTTLLVTGTVSADADAGAGGTLQWQFAGSGWPD